MSVVIEFSSDKDMLSAIRVFRDTDEPYYGVSESRLIVSQRAKEHLEKAGVGFRILRGEQKRGGSSAKSPRL